MIVAKRPLRRIELESGIVLDGQVPKITKSTRLQGDVLTLCNPIIDVEEVRNFPSKILDPAHLYSRSSLRRTSACLMSWKHMDTLGQILLTRC